MSEQEREVEDEAPPFLGRWTNVYRFVIVYLAERFHLRIRVFPASQLAIVVLLLLGLYEFILFWIDGVADRTVPLIERWAPPLTGTLLWLVMFTFFDAGRREARARF